MRIVIAEDSALLRAGIERILADAGHEVVAGVPDATNLLRLVNEYHPDLAILDVRMPPTFTDEGIRAAALLRSQNPESPVLVLSHYVEERYAAWLAEKAAQGVTFKPEQLRWLEAIKDHIAASLAIDAEALEDVPFKQMGGLGAAHEVFGESLPTILSELNERLAA